MSSDWDDPLGALVWHWGSAYIIGCHGGGPWIAQRRDTRETLRAETPLGLRDKIIADYTERPVSRDLPGQPGAGTQVPACGLSVQDTKAGLANSSYRLSSIECQPIVEAMEVTQQVARANERLMSRYCTEEERQQQQPLDPAVLIGRVIAAAASAKPTADVADLRAGLALVAADRWATERRELNLIQLARSRGMSWRDIAWSLDLDSSQAAEKRFQRLTRPPEDMIYAFRVAEPGEPWHGNPDALRSGYDTGFIEFNPARPGPFRGHTLEVRYGPTEEEWMPGPMREYAPVNNRRIALTARVQRMLFDG